MNIAILTSGGDCSGMNPAIKRYVEYAIERGLKPFAVYDGLEGLIDGRIEPLSPTDVSGVIHCGGTVIRSSRSPEFHESETRRQAAEHLRARGIAQLVMLGGDGSYRAMQHFHAESDIRVACVPATIDNDVSGSEYSLGVDSALNVIRQAIDSIRDTASSYRRAFVIETMGRECGYLALVSAIVSGAEVCLVPELEFDRKGVIRRLQGDIERGRRYAIAVVSEAVEGGGELLMKMFKDDIGMDCRMSVLGHLQRGGPPTVYDRRMAAELSTAAIDGLLDGEEAFAVACVNGKLMRVALEGETGGGHAIDAELMRLGERLAR